MARYIDAEKIKYHNDIHNVANVKLAFKNEIDAIPTADVQPVIHGHWKQKLDCQAGILFICSNCGYGTYNSRLYCANCGAKMDEEVK